MVNRENLKKLADYLSGGKLQKKFDMGEFENPCGTVGCAVGHGPDAGISKDDVESWNIYSERVYTDDDATWEWCFSDAWVHIDNTPEGAAKRINWLLEHGLPSNWDAQMQGNEPLCY